MALKTDLRDPDLRLDQCGLDTARSTQLCRIRIRAPACPCKGKVVY